MKNIIYSEMMVHVPMCTSKMAKDLLIISNNPEKLSAEASRHAQATFKVSSCNLEDISSHGDKSYDVIISEMPCDELLLAQINRIIRDDGQFVTTHESLENIEANKSLIKKISRFFKVVMPYNLGDCSTALFASKEYHPTADIILQRADMLDGLSYYNCDIHPAAFAMGNYIRKEYLGVIKN
ncbi:spermidine synthase [Sulfurimonas sp.]|uniref:spermidine synthase n=1 Tax=Sulfurimonas sp. TaxID=2022749 RepID=UPI0025E2EE97|nr:spermidine synthase [Sulfurimonas sp.]